MQPTIENLKKVYNILEDEESRFTYLNRLNYLVTGDIAHMLAKLAISLYHKPEDMTEIPLYIQSLVPEYKFYVRHHSNCYTETVFYAIFPH